MKKACIFTIVFYLILTCSFALTTNETERAANSFLRERNCDLSIESVNHLQIHGKMKINVVNLEPKGFILMSVSKDDVPVLGYSFSSDLEINEKNSHIYKKFLSKMILLNRSYFSEADNILEWDLLISGQSVDRPVDYWPPSGTTTTGGWIETSWEQYAPYNMFCPNDPVNQSQRSLAGCPSVAMSMIVDFHKQTNSTTFTQDDSYIAQPGYTIGVDHDNWGFLSFPEVNSYIAQVQNCYNNNTSLSDTLKAALIFACGIAARQQSYTSGGSGTYFTPQIENGYRRFGFNNAVTLIDSDIDLFERLKQNMMLGLPAQMCALISTGGGHQIIVDGYNTNEEFHFNFGWGGMADGWYSFPLSGMPSGLNIFSSVVLDINKNTANYTDFSFISPSPPQSYSGDDNLTISLDVENINDINDVRYFIDGTQWYQGSNVINYTYNVFALESGYHNVTAVLTNSEGNSNYKSVNFHVHRDSLIYSENFDTGLNGWTDPDNIWDNSQNELVSFNFIDAINVYSPTTHANFQNLNSTIISPPVQIPVMDVVNVEFYTAYAHQYPQYPSLRLKARMDGGNWMTLWTSSDQTGMYCWTKQTVDMTVLMGTTSEFAFECSGATFGDISFDDFRIYGRNNTSVEENRIGRFKRAELKNYPNPFNPETCITFTLPEQQVAKLAVFNIKGQRITTLVDGTCPQGENSVVWKGTDDEGNHMGSGLYFLKLDYSGKSTVSKMILLK